MRRLLLLSLAVLALVTCMTLTSGQVNATEILTDLNSTAVIDPAGASSWTVDGKNHLFDQLFFYRIGDTGGESSLGDIFTASSSLSNFASFNYSGAGFDVLVNYVLTGGSAGSGTADLAETIRIRNNGTSALSFHFFQYCDFDLVPNIGDDIGRLTNANTVRQSDSGTTLSETVVTPVPSHWEINTYPNTLFSLTNGSPTTLSDGTSPLGPGDITWAFQWDFNLAPGGTFIISKDKLIHPVPLPPSVLLLGTGLLGVGLLRFRRKNSA
jgi:hypothetical protein